MGNHLTFQSNPTIHTPLFYPASHIPNLSCPPLRSPPRLKSTLSFPLEALFPGAPSPTTTLSSPPEALSPGAPSPTTTLSSPPVALSPGAPSPRTMLSSPPVELSLGAPSPKDVGIIGADTPDLPPRRRKICGRRKPRQLSRTVG